MPTGIRVDRKAESEELFFSEPVAPPEPAVEADILEGHVHDAFKSLFFEAVQQNLEWRKENKKACDKRQQRLCKTLSPFELLLLSLTSKGSLAIPTSEVTISQKHTIME